MISVLLDTPEMAERIQNKRGVGMRGKLLRHLLQHAGVSRDGYEICYVGEECQYDTILACGQLAHEATGGTGSAYEHAGIVRKWSRHTVVTTCDPLYVRTHDEYVPQAIMHVHRAMYPVAAFDHQTVQIKYTMPGLTQNELIIFDVETTGLQWYDTASQARAELLCIVLTYDATTSYVVPVDAINVADLQYILQNNRIVGHNIKFDQHIIEQQYGIKFTAYGDTMLMHYALHELGRHGLKELARQYLQAADYEQMYVEDVFTSLKIAKKDRDYGLLPKDNLYTYAAIDGVVTYRLCELFTHMLQDQGLWDTPYMTTYMPIANSITQVEQNGVPVDREHLEYTATWFTDVLKRKEIVLTTSVLDNLNPETVPLFTVHERVESQTPLYTKSGRLRKNQNVTTPTIRINLNSTTDVHNALYKVFKLLPTRLLQKPTKTNTGKDALEALPDHPFVTGLREYRRVEKLQSTYVTGLLRRLNTAGRINVDFRLTGTEIGRLSASNGDHGIPRPDDAYGAAIRSAFYAPPGYKLLIADYNQAELRAFAWLSQCAFLLDAYRQNKDVHTETALFLEQLGAKAFQGFAQLTGDAKKRIRTYAKNVNFGGLVYQGGANGISRMMNNILSTAEVSNILSHYKPHMHDAIAWQEAQFKQLCRNGYVETVFGRRRRFYVISDVNEHEAKKAAVHMQVAGSAADCTNMSIATLIDQKIEVVHSVHDSILVLAKEAEAAHVAAHVHTVMVATASAAMPGIPWLVDVEIADRWCDTPAELYNHLTLE